jgi:hypothetical protein
MESHILDISHVIQLSVAPVFLLTGIATLINAMNTRLGRIVDRRRKVLERVRNCDDEQANAYDDELLTLYRRSHLSYLGIFCSVLSALLVCLVIVGAFVGALISEDLTKTIAVVFILAMLSMIAALGLFLREVFLGVSTGTHTTH